MKKRAYSYVRFSRARQADGDSLRRQMRLAVEYAERHGLELDYSLTFQDLGLSAYHGANVTDGRLGDFRKAVENGMVPTGSFLLVENLDRVSRQSARRAVRTLEDICELGVTVVTLLDGKVYTAESLDGFDFIFSVLLFMRAHDESELKSIRSKCAWQGKRERVRDKPLTAKCPSWLRLIDGKFELMPERAAIVRRIFDEFLSGQGKTAILQRLNREGVPVISRASLWNMSYIASILSNGTAAGIMTPHIYEQVGTKIHRVPLEPIKGYYPAVIPQKRYDRVQQILSVTKQGRRPYTKCQSILARTAKCSICGAAMARIRLRRTRLPFLLCRNATNGMDCTGTEIPYQRLASVFLNVLHESLFNFPDKNELATSVAQRLLDERQKLKKQKAEQAHILREIEAVANSDDTLSGILTRRLLKRGQEIKTIEQEIYRLVTEHKETSPNMIDVIRKEFIAEMNGELPRIEQLNSLIRALFSRVELCIEATQNVRFVARYKAGPVLECHYDDSSYQWRYLE